MATVRTFIVASALMLLPGVASAAAARQAATPLTKVIDMLDGMLAKGKEAMDAEQVEYAKYSTWCTGTKDTYSKSIDEASAQLLQLDAASAKAKADAEGLATEVSELGAKIAAIEAEEASATTVRDAEKADYAATHKDFSESVDAIERAVQVLKARSADVKQSLVQVKNSKLIPAHAKAAIASFLAIEQQGEAQGPPEANAYEFQSSSVVDMLEKLAIKFKDQRTALEKTEISSRSNHEVLMQQLSDDKKAASGAVTTKTAAKAGRLEDAAIADQDTTVTKAAKGEDEKALTDTTAACSMKSDEYEKNQAVRADELEALNKAVEILKSETVSGASDKHLPASLLQQVRRAKTALVALRSESSQDEKLRERAVLMLQAGAKKFSSQYLAIAAAHAAGDPFGKVKKMVKDLIVKLMEEANGEADHQAYCQTELATNKMTREDKSAEVDKLSAQFDEKTAESAQLASEITALSDETAELRGKQAEATTLRQEEKATNKETVEDAKAAQIAVEKAKQVLANYYSKAAEAFVQTKEVAHHAGKAPYNGMQADGGNILDFLEVVLSDFARLEAETSADEDQAEAAYEKFMTESTQDIEVRTTEMTHKENSKADADDLTESLKKELDLTHSELTAAMDYYEKLKPECVDNGLSYEDRVESRKQEIQSLKEALLVLNGEELA